MGDLVSDLHWYDGSGPGGSLTVAYPSESETALRSVAGRMLRISGTLIAQTYAAYKERRYSAMTLLRDECILRYGLLAVDCDSVILKFQNIGQPAHG